MRSVLLVLCFTSLTAWSAPLTRETDQELMMRLGPVVQDILEKPYDENDGGASTIAQTETHVFVETQIEHGWSVSPELPAFFNSDHPVDMEDVSVVYRKADDAFVWVMMDVNNHGDRVVYLNPSEVDPSEMAKNWDGAAASFEKNFLYVSRLAKYFIEPEKAPFFEEHPVVLSMAQSHALSRGGFHDMVEITKMLRSKSLSISAPRGADIRLGNHYGIMVNNLSMTLTPALLESMDFTAGVRQKSPQKTRPCQSVQLSLNGKMITSPQLPTHIDPVWYLKEHHPNLLLDIQQKGAAADRDRWLQQPEADLAYIFPAQPMVPGKDPICPRLDPARVFAEFLPKTFAAQRGSRNYTRYQLMEIEAAAFRAKP